MLKPFSTGWPASRPFLHNYHCQCSLKILVIVEESHAQNTLVHVHRNFNLRSFKNQLTTAVGYRYCRNPLTGCPVLYNSSMDVGLVACNSGKAKSEEGSLFSKLQKQTYSGTSFGTVKQARHYSSTFLPPYLSRIINSLMCWSNRRKKQHKILHIHRILRKNFSIFQRIFLCFSFLKSCTYLSTFLDQKDECRTVGFVTR